MDLSTTGSESEVDTKYTLLLAGGSGKEGRNPTANATTTTNHEKKVASAID
jgi:hypothetical protein